jgi:hypothetical protein
MSSGMTESWLKDAAVQNIFDKPLLCIPARLPTCGVSECCP